MENKEYYTPDRTDFFIGYEYEYESNNIYGGDKWVKAEFSLREVGEFDEGFMLDFLLEKGMIRVSYLSKEDIIDLGFKEGFDFTSTKHLQFVKGSIWISGSLLLDVWYDKTPFKLCLKVIENKTNIDGYDITTLFTGTCKSKNELKKLMKDYLNIPV